MKKKKLCKIYVKIFKTHYAQEDYDVDDDAYYTQGSFFNSLNGYYSNTYGNQQAY